MPGMEEMPTTSSSQRPVQERHDHLKSFRMPLLILFKEDTFAGVIFQVSLQILTKTRKDNVHHALVLEEHHHLLNVTNFLTTITLLVPGGHHHPLQRHQTLDNYHSSCPRRTPSFSPTSSTCSQPSLTLLKEEHLCGCERHVNVADGLPLTPPLCNCAQNIAAMQYIAIYCNATH